MAITPDYQSGTQEEDQYIDRGAVTMPQMNPEVDRKYSEGKAEALAKDYVEWPTAVHGMEY
jgi:hypothetical protein